VDEVSLLRFVNNGHNLRLVRDAFVNAQHFLAYTVMKKKNELIHEPVEKELVKTVRIDYPTITYCCTVPLI
jgi:hypothetical protein